MKFPRKLALPPEDEASKNRESRVPRLMLNNTGNLGNTKVIKNAFKPRMRSYALKE